MGQFLTRSPPLQPTPQSVATKRLLESVQRSELEEGVPWLSSSEALVALELFHDEGLCNLFNGLVDANDKEMLRHWLRRQLEQAKLRAGAGAPGASGAL